MASGQLVDSSVGRKLLRRVSVCPFVCWPWPAPGQQFVVVAGHFAHDCVCVPVQLHAWVIAINAYCMLYVGLGWPVVQLASWLVGSLADKPTIISLAAVITAISGQLLALRSV